MKKPKFMLKTLSMFLVLNAHASLAEEKLTGYKVAIVKDFAGSDHINAGFYQKGIDELSSASTVNNSYNASMNLCVAEIKSYKFEQAEASCSKAIKTISATIGRGRHDKTLAALAYSNRAVAKQLNGKSLAAYDDFKKASEITENDLVAKNFTYFKQSFSLKNSNHEIQPVTAD